MERLLSNKHVFFVAFVVELKVSVCLTVYERTQEGKINLGALKNQVHPDHVGCCDGRLGQFIHNHPPMPSAFSSDSFVGSLWGPAKRDWKSREDLSNPLWKAVLKELDPEVISGGVSGRFRCQNN
jgi:hypothetical protein